MAEILGVEPTIVIPRPVGSRVTVVEIKTTLSIEEQYRKAGLVPVASDDNRPKNTCGIIIALGRDPVVHDNYSIGEGVYFFPHSGSHVKFEGIEFRTLDWNDILNVVEEEKVPEDWKVQVRNFLLGKG